MGNGEEAVELVYLLKRLVVEKTNSIFGKVELAPLDLLSELPGGRRGIGTWVRGHDMHL